MNKASVNIKSIIRDSKKMVELMAAAAPQTAVKTSFCILLQALIPVCSLYIIKILIDAIAHPAAHSIKEIGFIIIIYSFLQLLNAAITQWSLHLGQIYQQKLSDYLSTKILYKAAAVAYPYYENTIYQNTLHLTQQQALFKAPQLFTNFLNLFQQLLSLVLFGALLFTLHWLYALIFLALSLPLTAVKWYYGKKSFAQEKELVEKERQSFYLQQLVTHSQYAKELRIFSVADFFISRYRQLRQFIFEERKKLLVAQSRYSLLAEIGELLVMAWLFYSLARNAWEQTITAGMLVIYLQGFQRMQSAARGWLQAMVNIYQQRLFIKHLFEFLDIPEQSAEEGVQLNNRIETLQINNLSFSYPNSKKQILNAVSLQAKAGDIIAIVGENGSGKSTLLKLLANLYPTATAGISVNGTNLSKIATKSYQEKTTVLFQDYEKYWFTVAENIQFGFDANDENAITKVAKQAGADGFIEKLPDGYQTQLGTQFRSGVQISGGQWQKLAIAKIFYRNAQLLILDEPGSSLDAASEFALFEVLYQQKTKRITIIVTHRLYSIQKADIIYVMHNGSIAEKGSFTELAAQNGYFASMLEKQRIRD